jgi:hypothetical protein
MSKNINKKKSSLEPLKSSKDFIKINFKKSKDEFPMLTNYKKNNMIGNTDFQNENNPSISIYRSIRKKENLGSNSLIKLSKDNWPNWKEKVENNLKNISSFKDTLLSDNFYQNNQNIIYNSNDITNNNSLLLEINGKFSQSNLKLQLSNKKKVQDKIKSQPRSMKNLDDNVQSNKKLENIINNNNNDLENNEFNNNNSNKKSNNNNNNNNKSKFDRINNKEILINSNSLKLPKNFLKFDSELFSSNPLKTIESQKKDINSRINTDSKFIININLKILRKIIFIFIINLFILKKAESKFKKPLKEILLKTIFSSFRYDNK